MLRILSIPCQILDIPWRYPQIVLVLEPKKTSKDVKHKIKYQIFVRFKSQLLASLNQIFEVVNRLKIDYFVSISNVVFLKAQTKISNLENLKKIRDTPSLIGIGSRSWFYEKRHFFKFYHFPLKK